MPLDLNFLRSEAKGFILEINSAGYKPVRMLKTKIDEMAQRNNKAELLKVSAKG